MKIEALILAAGLSSRMQEFKPLLKLGRQSLITIMVEKLSSLCGRIIVVGGHLIERLQFLEQKYPALQLVENRDYLKGMYSSVRAGLPHIKGDYFFCTPCDYPLIKIETYRKMALSLSPINSARQPGMLIPVYAQQKGHPLLINSHLKSIILDKPDYYNLRKLRDETGYQLLEVNDEGILLDMDTKEDYYQIKKKYEMSI